jgi:hypothetical protein
MFLDENMLENGLSTLKTPRFIFMVTSVVVEIWVITKLMMCRLPQQATCHLMLILKK